MTPEIFETLKAYVKQGGNLYITASHMRDSVDRREKGKFADVNWEELLGVKLSEETYRCNDGFKFIKNSTVDGVMYPGTKHFNCDPAWSAGLLFLTCWVTGCAAAQCLRLCAIWSFWTLQTGFVT